MRTVSGKQLKVPLKEILADTPIIAAVKDEAGLESVLSSDIHIVFILFGDVCSLQEIVKRVKDAGKVAIVHMDLVNGFTGKDIVLDYIKKYTQADGIITTKSNLIKYAKQIGLYTILRYFVVDSMSLTSIEKQLDSVQPDVIEILPGIMPGIINKVNKISKVPIIAGGLIEDKKDVMTALDSGAIAISATNPKVWFL